MQHLEEGTIHAWLDGELQADEALAFEAHVAECSDCAAAVAEGRGLIAASSRIVSALDVVPAAVIPVPRPSKRAWYANTQLRAAAAVLVVAGASFLALRQEDEPSLLRLMDQRVPDSAVAADNVESRKEASVESSPPSAGSRQSQAVTLKSQPSLKPQAPVADAVSPVTPARIDSSNLRDGTAMSNLVITGVATASPTSSAGTSTASALRVVKSDTTETTVVTVYAVAPDVEVTLSETGRTGVAAPSREIARLRREISGGSLPPQATEASRRARIESIEWTNYSTGRTYILSGALSKEELTAIRGRLPSGVR